MIGIMAKAQTESPMSLKSHSLAFCVDLSDAVPWCGHHNLHVSICSEYAACMHNSSSMIACLEKNAEPN